MSVANAQASMAVESAHATASQRRTALVVIGLAILMFAVFWPTTAALIVRWQDTVQRTYTHGYLVVAISLWLIWRDRARLAPARSFTPGLVPLLAASFVWLVAWRAGIQIAHQALLPALILIAVTTCCGLAVTRQLLLPILYLYCAVPVWDALNPLLQWISVLAVRTLLLIGNIPAYFEGNRFQLPAGSFEIADGCSGLHFFIVAFSISVFYGAINRDVLRMRLKLIAFALLLAMLTNWLRIFIIVLAGHLTDMQHALIQGEHYTFGWFMFAGAMTLFFLVVRRWPVVESAGADQVCDSRSAPTLGGLAATLGALALVPVWAALDRNQTNDTARHTYGTVSGWTEVAASSSWRPRFKGADLEQHAEYLSTGATVESYLVTYRKQQQGKEIAGYENSVFGDMTRANKGAAAAPVGWSSARAIDATGKEWQMLYTYIVGDREHTSLLHAQLDYGLRSLFGAPLSSVVVLRSACRAGCEGADLALRRFVAAAAIIQSP